MSFWRSIAAFFNPCVHAWEVLEKLKDHPKHPTVITIVKHCAICGETDTTTITGPPSRVQPPHRHVWKTVTRTTLVGKHLTNPDGSKQQNTIGYRLEQQCSCGDVRTVLTGLGWDDLKRFGYDGNKLPPGTVLG